MTGPILTLQRWSTLRCMPHLGRELWPSLVQFAAIYA
jgi:hypothetical protein